MDATTFFGYSSCNKMFDARRHVNLLYTLLCGYQLMINQNLMTGRGMIAFNYAKVGDFDKSYLIFKNEVLAPYQINFLNFIKQKVFLSDDEYKTILSGIGFQKSEIRTPAGYSKIDNIKLFIQCVVSTAFMQPQIQEAINENLQSIFKTFSHFCTIQELINIMRITENVSSIYNNYDEFITNYDIIESKVLAQI